MLHACAKDGHLACVVNGHSPTAHAAVLTDLSEALRTMRRPSIESVCRASSHRNIHCTHRMCEALKIRILKPHTYIHKATMVRGDDHAFALRKNSIARDADFDAKEHIYIDHHHRCMQGTHGHTHIEAMR